MNFFRFEKMKMKQFNLVTMVLYLILIVLVYKNNTACLRDENNELTYVITTHARRIKVHRKNTIKNKEHERRKKEKEERDEEKRRLYFVQNLEARLVASSILRDFYAGRF